MTYVTPFIHNKHCFQYSSIFILALDGESKMPADPVDTPLPHIKPLSRRYFRIYYWNIICFSYQLFIK